MSPMVTNKSEINSELINLTNPTQMKRNNF